MLGVWNRIMKLRIRILWAKKLVNRLWIVLLHRWIFFSDYKCSSFVPYCLSPRSWTIVYAKTPSFSSLSYILSSFNSLILPPTPPPLPTPLPNPHRRKIRMQCKMSLSKKLTCKGPLRQVVYLSEALSSPMTPYSPPPGRQLPPLSSVLYGIISERRSVLATQLLLREKSGS